MAEKRKTTSVNRILVAVDGSEHSKKAVGMAIDMAKKWNSKIYLIHVAEKNIPSSFIEFARDEGIDAFDYFERVCSQILGSAEDRVKKAGIKKVERTCPTGNPADEIIKEARKKKVDLIIMGSRGLGRFSRAVMGSVSTKVCNHADSTCITVK